MKKNKRLIILIIVLLAVITIAIFDKIDWKIVAAAQDIAQVGKQRVVGGAGEISAADEGGVALAARAAGHHKSLLLRHKMGGHGGFYAHLVDGVDHKIKRLGKKRAHVFRVHKIFDFVHGAGGVDLQDAPVQRGYFGQAEIVGERVELAVGVGFGHVVQINQRELADAAARQRLHRPRAHAARAHHANIGLGKALQGGRAVESGNAAEAALVWGGSNHRDKSKNR